MRTTHITKNEIFNRLSWNMYNAAYNSEEKTLRVALKLNWISTKRNKPLISINKGSLFTISQNITAKACKKTQRQRKHKDVISDNGEKQQKNIQNETK